MTNRDQRQDDALRLLDRAAGDRTVSEQEFWEEFHRLLLEDEPGAVNRYLMSEVADLAPSTALDVGCGSGADALWLAERGWTVTGVDVSAPAIDLAATHARRLGLQRRAAFQRVELPAGFPAGRWELVSMQFFHSPVAAPGAREDTLRRCARAVAPGGDLLVVSHAGIPSWADRAPGGLALPTAEENLAALELEPEEWADVRVESVLTELPGPDGAVGTRLDHIVHLRRRG